MHIQKRTYVIDPFLHMFVEKKKKWGYFMAYNCVLRHFFLNARFNGIFAINIRALVVDVQ